MSEAEQPIPKSDLPTRFAMGVAMIAVASAAIYAPAIWSDGVLGVWPFRLLVFLAAAVMLVEWADMHRVARSWAYGGCTLLFVLLLGITELFYPGAQMDVGNVGGTWVPVVDVAAFGAAWIGAAIIVGAALILGLAARRTTMAGGFLYVALPSFALLVLHWTWFGIVFWVMIVTWATDICAYFAGRSIGGPKLAPRLSPNKTWAGLAGGMLGAGLCGYAASSFLQLGAPFSYLGAAMGAAAQGGDLYESWLKRRAGVKDSGTILPGHGGALDRLDGLLPVILLTFLLLAAGLWTG
ncbi:phosphatidate cytidylyltransferase [Sphingosinicella rhizophila]|uniref:Phosphatidate cytidylyltransferase n=1 Tax=Sphingosinicella rhizophila TaxID=3050082 RepID=A0ABU3Q2Z6_9SPHN|nr:phosphatidate cytidylyltransferase [Sphingosinicella sp. GR2756]MDT9597687.1 phosphatidate cytidylyltransferase [Sphingosinicella sp. GR2756]